MSQKTFPNLTHCVFWLLQNLEFTPLSLGSVFHSDFPLNTLCWDTRGKALSLHGMETPPCFTKRFKAHWVFCEQSMDSASLRALAQRVSIPSAWRRGREGHVSESIPFGKVPSACRAEGTAEMGVETRTTGNWGFRERQTPCVCWRLCVLCQRSPRSSSTSRAAVPRSVAVLWHRSSLAGMGAEVSPCLHPCSPCSPFVLAAALPLLALSSCSASLSSFG